MKDYYQAQEGDPEPVLEKYKDIIIKEFRDGYTGDFPKARLSVFKKQLKIL